MSVSPAAKSDRYVSFRDIDFEGNMSAVLAHLNRHIGDPAKSNALWDRFRARLAEAEAGGNVRADKLLLLHSHVYYMVDLFEEAEDEEALAALRKLEEECF
jgi:N(2)-fixation sustaining protein CowN